LELRRLTGAPAGGRPEVGVPAGTG